jgi:hypothetical protein
MKRREFNKSLAAATAISVSPFSLIRNARAATAGGGATQVFNYANFTGSLNDLYLANASVLGSALQLINSGNGHHGAQAWYRTQQPPGSFTTTFSFQFQNISGVAGGVQSGFTFYIQNQAFSPPSQPGYTGFGAGGDANMCGYGCAQLSYDQYPPQDSLGIKFDSGSLGQTYPSGGFPSSTGMYLNAGTTCLPGKGLAQVPYVDLNPFGINFYNQNVCTATIVYDGSFLTMVIVDTSTNKQARFVWPLNLPATTNAIGNWVGFSCGTARQGYLLINNWAYWSGYNTRLTAPTFSVASGQYTGTQSVAINAPSGSNCYYTINGLAPTSSSTLYTGPITISANAFVQAVAIQSGYTDSYIGTASYQIGNYNVINYPSGFASGSLILCGYAYLSGSTVQLSDTTQGTGSAIWYPGPVAVNSFATSFTVNYGSQGQGMAFVLQNTPPAFTGLTGVQITGSGGQISFNATKIKVGDYVTISGTNSGSGSIGGFSNQAIYSIGATNGSTTATLTTAVGWDSSSNPGSLIPGKAVSTTAGTPAGLTFSLNAASFTGGPTVVGAAYNAIGYGGMDATNGPPFGAAPGILSSVAVVINQQSFTGISGGNSDPANGVGLYTNGAVPYGSQIATGLNFQTGSWIVTLSYDGTTLTFSMQAAGGGAKFTHSWPINIPSIVGGTTAYAGFTGGTYGAASITAIQSWTYTASSTQTSNPVPAAPTNLQVK